AGLIAAIGVLTALFYAGALHLRGEGVFAMSRNADFGKYLIDAKVVLSLGAARLDTFPAGIPKVLAISQVLNFQLRGCVFPHAFMSAFFGADLARIAYPLSAFVMFLNIVTFRMFFKDADIKLRIALPILGILVFNAFWQRMVFDAFTGQLYSFGMVTLAFYIEYHLAERGQFDPWTCVLLVFVLTANGLAYVESVAFPLIPALALLIPAVRKGLSYRKPCLKNAALAGGLFLAANWHTLVLLISIFLFHDKFPPGYAENMPTPADVAGLRGLYGWPFISEAGTLMLAACANAAIIFALVCRMKKERVFSFMGASLLLFTLFHLLVCLRYFRPGQPSAYSVFKSAMSMSFIVVVFLVRFLEDGLKDGLGSRASAAISAVFAVFFLLDCASAWRSTKILSMMPGTGMTESHKAIEIFSKNASYADADFFLHFDDDYLDCAAIYEAPLGRSFSSRRTNLTVPGGGATKSSFKKGDIYITDAAFEEVAQTTDARPVFENDIYKVFELGDRDILLYERTGMDENVRVALVEGEYAALRSLREQTVGFRFWAMADKRIGIRATFLDESAQTILAVKAYLNGKYSGTFLSEGSYVTVTLEDINMKRGRNEIRLEFEGDMGRTSLAGMSILGAPAGAPL
ncbi:MAG: hypothetical protein LBU13_00985, partial [Synergistaceae bacterium]|nr:hypothetical protein [Synergistaceae bacterium]